ncbi:MAG: hypothetical protein ACKVU1_02440 [bacterium]
MTLLQDALDAPWCVISVMGAHAGEDVNVIFDRKAADCQTAGQTFWVAKSAKARPGQVQELCASSAGYVIFVEPATPGGARPTTQADRATEYSADRLRWLALPPGIGPVTGQLDGAATALVFDRLATNVEGVLDLWRYSDAASPDLPVRFKLGLSTVCALRETTALHPYRMKSRYRGIVAVGRLKEPYCAWVR